MARSQTNFEEAQVHTVQEALARFYRTLAKQNYNALLTKEFLDFIHKCTNDASSYIAEMERLIMRQVSVGLFRDHSQGDEALQRGFTCGREVLVFLDELFQGIDGKSSSNEDLNQFVDRFNQLLTNVTNEAERLQQFRDEQFPRRQMLARIRAALIAIALLGFIGILVCSNLALPMAVLVLVTVSFFAAMGAAIFVNTEFVNTGVHLTPREKMLNTNISLFGKVKGTLFGLPSESSETKLVDRPLKDLPEPIVSKPLLFTCC